MVTNHFNTYTKCHFRYLCVVAFMFFLQYCLADDIRTETVGDRVVTEYHVSKYDLYYYQYFGNLILNYFNRVDSLITPHPFGQATLARSPHFGA